MTSTRETIKANTRQRDAEIASHYAESKSLQKTAAHFGVCRQRIHQRVRRHQQRQAEQATG